MGLKVLEWPAMAAFATLLALGLATPAGAQDMDPRSYANTPIDLNLVGVGYVYSWGSVLVDSSLPIEDLTAKLNIGAVVYGRTMSIFGWGSKVVATVPYAHLFAEGLLEGEPASGTRQGFADPRVRLNVNFIGAPALRLRDFGQYNQKWLVGTTLEIRPPLGSYDTSKVINAGANRWTFLAEAGVSRRIRRWTLEGAIGAVGFTANNQYLGDSTLKQQPVTYADLHVIFNFQSNIWLAFDALWVWGGQTELNGTQRADIQTNTRAGLTFSFPIAKRHALKIFAASGVTTRFGADFRSVGLSWVMNWGGM